MIRTIDVDFSKTEYAVAEAFLMRRHRAIAVECGRVQRLKRLTKEEKRVELSHLGQEREAIRVAVTTMNNITGNQCSFI